MIKIYLMCHLTLIYAIKYFKLNLELEIKVYQVHIDRLQTHILCLFIKLFNKL
jgi:hypothetical protein